MARFAAFFNWIGRRSAGASLFLRFGPMNVRAYATLLRVVVAERLWWVPQRHLPKGDQYQ
jgi:hypothetical protein